MSDGALTLLIERTAVMDTITRLFLATDRRDWKAVEACLADEVLFDMSSGGGGPARRVPAHSITEGWDAQLKPIEHVHHQAGNFIVQIDGERATSSCYGVAFHHRSNASGRNTRLFVGSYDFDLEKLAGAWRITTLRFHLSFLEGNPQLETS